MLLKHKKYFTANLREEQFFFTQSHFLRSNTDKALREHLKKSYLQIDEELVKHWIHMLIERWIIFPPQSLNGKDFKNINKCKV